MYPKAMIFLAIVGVSLSSVLGLFSIITFDVVAILIAVFIGIPTLITQVRVKPKEEEIEHKQEGRVEEKEILREETIRIGPHDAYSYDIDLKRGDILKGEISSDSHIDIHFVNNTNFMKWERDKTFECEYSGESVLKTKIDYEIPRRGTWYLLIENNGRKSTKVKVCLY